MNDRLRELAEAARESGATADARRYCRQLLEQVPGDRTALNLMAEVAADEGRLEEGHHWAKLALAADPHSARPHYTEGRLLQGEGRAAEAETSYRRALAFAPDSAKVHNNLGCVLHMQGKLELALASYRKALEIDPQLPQASQNYASIVRDEQAMELAVAGYLREVAAHPNDADAFNNLGNLYREMGRHGEALASFERAIALRPDFAEAHFSRSFVLLLYGEYSEGWKEYEWRWRVKGLNTPLRKLPQPLWDGQPLPGGTVLLHAEQGFGDTLQFVRYASRVAGRCHAVVLECQPELRELLRTVPGLHAIGAPGDPLPRFDAHLPLLSLPGVFGTTLENVCWQGPYVHADPARVKAWRVRLDAKPARLRVGLVWGGRPEQWDDRKRSTTLKALAPLAQAKDVTFYSLQKGPPSAQAASPPEGMRLIDLTGHLADFSDTAALMRHLDLVITVDTSVAHLAGAMGVNTWVLVAHAPDWRYHLERTDNPWYPTMRLYRQERDGDWSGAIASAARDLGQLPGSLGSA